MVNETLARRYATAIFSLASDAGAGDRIGEDLQSMAASIEGDAQAHQFFVAPVIARDDKERVLTAAFGGRVDEIALHAVLLLVRKRREALLGAIVAEYRKLQLQARGTEALTLTSARQLDFNEVRSMVERLERLYGKKYEVKQVVDPELIGGVRILMGDKRIDGTVSGRLEALARTLFAGQQ
ncbi:MAG: ATP synthase F1 subunit delta [Candidatus Eremiobacteraeota bacterium]|nr:ATP synthase F1 subunit delta [Candidatus Eremiobacteraeota bacterium]MBV8723235.1 ATP synthase F1 subunit delta [Candidatus Eremiobacteraeota bacterium]